MQKRRFIQVELKKAAGLRLTRQTATNRLHYSATFTIIEGKTSQNLKSGNYSLISKPLLTVAPAADVNRVK